MAFPLKAHETFCVCFTSEIIYVTHLFYQTWTTKLRGRQCKHD